MWTIPVITHPRKSLPLVFIVACPRSGTTLLQSLLASHSEIISFPETKFFVKAFPREEPRRKFWGLASHQLYPQLQSFFINDLKRPDIAKKLPKYGLYSWYVDYFFNLLSQIAREQGKRIVLEKTPEHINHLKTIDEYLPQAKVIHLVRNGPDVIASLYSLAYSSPSIWREFQDLNICLERWINKTKRSFMKARNKANHILVRYEHLAQNPQEEIQRLCDFLDIKFEYAMLENYGAVSHTLRREHEHWKQKVADPIKRQETQFDRVFSEEQKLLILSSIEKAGLSDIYIDYPVN